MSLEQKRVTPFEFGPGRRLAGKYEVISKLGEGWEGEVYLVKEISTGIERAAKFFFPRRNAGNKALNFYARKLYKLRKCKSIMQYHTQDTIRFRGTQLPFLVSEYIDGTILSEFMKQQRGKRLDYFQGLHLLHSLASAVEEIHKYKDFHGDLHTENVIVKRSGLGFDIRLLDFYPLDTSRREGERSDICDVIKLFYDVTGGRKWYAKHPPEVKNICCGLKRGLILKKFKTMRALREHLENMSWLDI